MRVRDRVFIVTGGASGLGEATARLLADEGALVAIFDRQEKLGKQVEQAYDSIRFYKVDVTDEQSVNKALDEVQKQWPEHKIAGLLNAAGIAQPVRTVNADGSPGSQRPFENTFRVNVFGLFNVSRLVASRIVRSYPPPPKPEPLSLTNEVPDSIPGALNEERGCIIHLGSTTAEEGQGGMNSYASSKGAVAALTLPMARDLAKYGIRVVTIAPALFKTPMQATAPNATTIAYLQQAQFPPRLGHPAELARMVLTIIENPMLNGSVLRLDGGIRLGRL